MVGKRDNYHARTFMADLADRVKDRVQFSTDALHAYIHAVDYSCGSNADYGQIVKTYSVVNLYKEAASRYSIAQVVKKTVVYGLPDQRLISTSHGEKQNHTLRMHYRRLTPLTNAFSKKLGKFLSCGRAEFCVLQPLPDSRRNLLHPGSSCGRPSKARGAWRN
jgi:hypothetical protein